MMFLNLINIVVCLIFCSIVNSLYIVNKVEKDEKSIFELSVIHMNDFHGRFDQISPLSTPCTNKSECIGGFSRMYTEIKKLLQEKPNSLLVNGGDNFQGSLYYEVGKENITLEFMKKLPWDAVVIGNHDFEDGVQGLAAFIESMKVPFLASNIDASKQPNLRGKFTKSTIIERNGKKIGIIGVIYSKTNLIADTGNLIFHQESSAVNEEADRLVKEEGVFTNIVLSHSGYDVEKVIAANASEKIGLVVGAHSHTFLWTGDNPPGPDKPAGPYPTIVTSKNNKTVLVVQASCFTKYLGNISVFYNAEGEVESYSGAPIFLGHEKPTDKSIDEELKPWTQLVENVANKVMGSTLVELDSKGCASQECLLGNFYADGMVFEFTKKAPANSWTYAAVGVISLGWTNVNFLPGNMIYNDLYLAQQYKNTIDVGELEGKFIKQALEQGTDSYANDGDYTKLQLLQVSGLKVTYDLRQPKGHRVRSIKIRCQNCLTPSYEDLNLNQIYKVIVSSWTRKGLDQFSAISDNIKNVEIGNVDLNVTLNYLQYRSPVFEQIEERIVIFK